MVEVSTSVMAEAFSRAGYQTPLPKHIQIGIDAWAKWSDARAGGARRDYVRGQLSREATWIAMEQLMPQRLTELVGMILNQASLHIEEARDAAKAAGGGQIRRDTQLSRAPTNPSALKAVDDRGQIQDVVQKAVAPVVAQSPDAGATRPVGGQMPDDIHGNGAPSRTITAKLAVAARLSRLDTVMVGDKPIGDCTVAEVRVWAIQRQSDARVATRDARFALGLVANLPSSAVIREWWRKPEEVDAIYARAEMSDAA